MKFYNTIDEIKDACPKFFGKDEMRNFGSRICQTVYAGRYFITSEKNRNESSRRYTIREVVAEDGEKPYIHKVGEFGAYASAYEASAMIKQMIEKGQVSI